MCGIIGIVSQKRFTNFELLECLKKLEYRGYDSVGYALRDGSFERDIGYIDDFEKKIEKTFTTTAITHTRWATHGGITKKNAHPHFDCKGNLFLVHNGIIENFSELKEELLKRGHEFRSETDSEVIVHYIEEKLKSIDFKEIIPQLFKEFEGTYGFLVMLKGKDRIYAVKKDSPLVLGIAKDRFILSSDIYGFSHLTKKSIFFEDFEFAEITPKGYRFYDESGKEIEKEIKTFKWQELTLEKKKYPHFMLKEIHEQPEVSRRLLDSLKTHQREKIENLKNLAKSSKRILFAASGTSYHASLLGVYFLHRVGIDASTLIASEFQNFMTASKDTLVVAISQSGETMDVVKALKYAKKRGSKIVSIVNVPYSTVQRMSDFSIEILAGQEICVASTKTFQNQVLVLLYLAELLGYEVNLDTYPKRAEMTLGLENKITELAERLKDMKDIYVIGRGLSYPVAREMALKLKEISYIHAEGMMGGELKHGTIALIERGTPVISLISNRDLEMLSNTKEVEARGADVTLISNNHKFKPDFLIKTSNDGKFCILSTMIGQLLSYHIANLKGLPIDKPRNLAKSVTVK
ncbi:MAG: glutamine--fructose-6-phosphate transaminase (isomerizing) [Candidatus Methanofastidiosia archaeon]